MIRRCTVADLRQVLAIEGASFKSPYDYQTILHYLRWEPEGFLVIEEDGAIAGYVIYSVRGEKGLLVSLAVAPGLKGRGLGKRLLEYALKELSKRARTVELQVSVSNKEALSLYEGLGFEARRVIRGYYQDGEDALVMVKGLKGQECSKRGATTP